MVELSKLVEVLRKSWNRDTCYEGCVDEWSPDNPAWGQCAVTALVVQDYLGGKIVWTMLTLPDGRRAAHYFNEINEEEIDLTKEQLPEGTIVPRGEPRTEKGSTRDYILSFPITLKQRYELLKQRVEEEIKRSS